MADMKPEEAILQIKGLMYTANNEEIFCEEDANMNVEALNLAISALKKQIPKKLKNKRSEEMNDFGDSWTQVFAECENCGWTVTGGNKFCPNCGQAIDWSE